MASGAGRVHLAQDSDRCRRGRLDDTDGRWIIASRPSMTTGRRVYSVEGKTLRGSGMAGVQVHLLAVLDQHTGTVLGHP
jgi:hypothetical protein